MSLQEVIGEIKKQIRLRHSAYYENENVISTTADFLIEGRGEYSDIGLPQRPLSNKIPEALWELLLVGNVALYFLLRLVVSGTKDSLLLAFDLSAAAYAVPFIVVGGSILKHRRKKEGYPSRLWRRFRITWAVWAVLCFFVVLLDRLGL